MIDPARPVCVVAGGPSLRGFDWRRLDGRQAIAINRACETIPGARIVWWSDVRFWRRHRDAILAHPAPLKATALRDGDGERFPPEVTCRRFTGVAGFDPRPGCLRHGNNGAYAALHLAASLGARRIVLLGCDMAYGPDGRSHWHNGHGFAHRERTLAEKMLPWFQTLAEPLAQRGVRVTVAAPTRIACWPVVSLDAALA